MSHVVTSKKWYAMGRWFTALITVGLAAASAAEPAQVDGSWLILDLPTHLKSATVSTTIRLSITRQARLSDGSWIAEANGVDGMRAWATRRSDGVVLANLHMPDGSVIAQDSRKEQEVVRQAGIHADCGTMLNRKLQQTAPVLPHTKATAAETRLDVLVVASQRLATTYGLESLAVQADWAVQHLSKSLSNSRVPGQAHLAGVVASTYQALGDMTADLRFLERALATPGDPLAQARLRLGGDVVCLLVDSGTFGGLADYSQPACVVNLTAGLSYAMPHEIGHCLGCAHNVEDANGYGTYGHGHRFTGDDGGKYRTVMAYGFPWVRLPLFSNPDIRIHGVACGVSGSSDNARLLRTTFPPATSWTTSTLPTMTLTAAGITEPVPYGTSIQITAQIVGHGQSIAGIQLGTADGVMVNVPIGSTASLTLNGLQPGPHRLRGIVTTSDFGKVIVDGPAFVVAADAASPLPSGWFVRDIGMTPHATAPTWDGTTLMPHGTGTDQALSSVDTSRFVYRPVEGNFVLTAQISDATYSVGVVVRTDLAPESPQMGVRDFAPFFTFIDRSLVSAQPTSNGFRVPQPWIRLSRTAGRVQGELSNDGITWTTLGDVSCAFPAKAYVGFLMGISDIGLTTGTQRIASLQLSGLAWDHLLPGAGGGGGGNSGGNSSNGVSPLTGGSGGSGNCSAGSAGVLLLITAFGLTAVGRMRRRKSADR